MCNDLHSLRMRSEAEGRHISGAERLLTFADLGDAVIAMLQRALFHSRGRADSINFQIEEVSADQVVSGNLPDLYNNQVVDWRQGRDLAYEMLVTMGVTQHAAAGAISSIDSGAAPDGQSMRGAMLVDADSGERLEPDQMRGIRVSRMDLTDPACLQLKQLLSAQQLDNSHVIEALTLAAKVIAAPGVVAELCWSDDPDYLSGYVASVNYGYQRISLMKPAGEQRGGRAFFVRCGKERIPALIEWLEKTPLMINRLGRIHVPRYWKAEIWTNYVMI